ncbi:MAG: hypothetical protein Q9191_005633 [Dirinaria sp. TL-2023a]
MLLFDGLLICFIASSLGTNCAYATSLTSTRNSLEQSAGLIAPEISNLINVRAPFPPAPSSPDPGGSNSDSDNDPGPSNQRQSQLYPGRGPRSSSILSAWFQLPQDWTITAWQTQTTFWPTTSAARDLQAFYQELFETAASEFWEGRSSPIWRFSSVGLSFWVAYDSRGNANVPTANQPHMSMAILSSIAFSLIEVTRRGFAGTYYGYIVDPDGNPFWIELERTGSP